MQGGIDDGPRLPSRVIDWAWRKEAVMALRKNGLSLRLVAQQVGCSYEKVRELAGER